MAALSPCQKRERGKEEEDRGGSVGSSLQDTRPTTCLYSIFRLCSSSSDEEGKGENVSRLGLNGTRDRPTGGGGDRLIDVRSRNDCSCTDATSKTLFHERKETDCLVRRRHFWEQHMHCCAIRRRGQSLLRFCACAVPCVRAFRIKDVRLRSNLPCKAPPPPPTIPPGYPLGS